MVSEEEIERVAKLMRIEVDDHSIHVAKVKKMIEYFDILDQAGVESEEIDVQETSVSNLRKDEHFPYDGKLIESLKKYKENYVRAPKMV